MTVDRAAWLEWRKNGLGASDIAAIVGLSPWRSAYSLWCEKVGVIEGQAETEAMAHGRYAEHSIRAWFEDNYDLRVIDPQRWCVHPTFEWARCTPDGLLVESHILSEGEPVGLIEFKVADWKVWDEIPDQYQCQAQWQMFVTGLTSVAFGVQHGKKFVRYDLERDDDDIAYLRDAAESFWHDYVVAGVAPDIDSHRATTSALGHRWQATDNSVDLDADTAKALDELRIAKAEQAWWADRRALLENQVKAVMGDASIGRVDGQVAVTWKRARRLDLDALVAAEPEVAKRYTTVIDTTALRKQQKKLVERFMVDDSDEGRRFLLKKESK